MPPESTPSIGYDKAGPRASGPQESEHPELRGRQVVLRLATEADVPTLAAIRATPEVRARWRGGADLSAEVRESIMDSGTHFLAIIPQGDESHVPARTGEAISARQAARTGEAISARQAARTGEAISARQASRTAEAVSAGQATRTGEAIGVGESDERTRVGAAEVVAGAIQWSAEDDPEYRHASIDIFLDPAVHGRGLGTDAVRTLAAYLVDVRGFHRLVIDPAADNEQAVRCYAKVGFRPVGIMREYELGADGTWHDGLLMDLLAAELIR